MVLIELVVIERMSMALTKSLVLSQHEGAEVGSCEGKREVRIEGRADIDGRGDIEGNEEGIEESSFFGTEDGSEDGSEDGKTSPAKFVGNDEIEGKNDGNDVTVILGLVDGLSNDTSISVGL